MKHYFLDLCDHVYLVRNTAELIVTEKRLNQDSTLLYYDYKKCACSLKTYSWDNKNSLEKDLEYLGKL